MPGAALAVEQTDAFATQQAALEQGRFGLHHFASIETRRPKRESCSTHVIKSKIHVP